MHVVHLTWGLGLGGLEIMLVNIANEQVNSIDVTIVIVNNIVDENLLRLIDERVNVIFLDRKAFHFDPIPLIKLNYLLWKIRPNVIHSHSEMFSRILCMTFFNRMIVYTVHDVGINERYIRKYRNRCAISKSVANDVKRRAGIDVPVIYNGVEFEKIKIKNNKSRNPCEFKIVQVSRLMHKKKGQDLLIHAVGLLRKRGITTIKLDLIGDGESHEFLAKEIFQDELQDCVSILGEKDHEYILNNLCNYDLLVQPSYFEGFGLTVAEAMAAGIPVLASDIDGPMEIIDNGRYGWSFRKGDVNDCASKILEMINVYDEEKISNARRRVKVEFNIKNTANKYIELYSKVVNL